ncbi:MmgE/PrpD family protein [Roseovarius sp. SCSIO 43702]|uniref:MmgE/PrpD family protein n=1 Tax=Roseovarius sp. SCSIO 43702 TaxID=2823043 RepID=UPI001C7397ED|nr:MmgE/PrpD family protein [Roseovarius sp. SCSIO 43702]QYX55499.1 MmgE/PrpD family protein [Roseovarius sp. SCSIO 43702]
MDKTVTDILDAARARPEEADITVMRLSLLDWLAVALAGRGEPVARITREMVIEEGGEGQATLVGGGRVPPRAAALVNGATSHALDYDDTHFAHIGHPSVAVIPAALALAEREGRTRQEMLGAALAGCEASIRFGILFGRGHYQAGFHQTATAGAFGATVAAALVLGLDEVETGHALGLAATRAAGLKAQFGTMGKPYNAGLAATTGLECADLAARGFVSNPDAITGQSGFLATHHADGRPATTTGFLMRDVSHKFHACCHGLHAALEALATLLPLDAHKVERVQVTTHPRWMNVCNQKAPETGLGAKFSYRAVMALRLLGYETAALATFEDGPVNEAPVRELMQRVEVVFDEGMSETQSRVRVSVEGEMQEAEHDLSVPIVPATREKRVREKAALLVGDAAAGTAWDVISHDGPIEAFSALLTC